MRARAIVLDVLTAVAAASAVVMVVLTVRRERAPTANAVDIGPRRIANADAYANVGHRVGSANARVTLVEFGDFQCPACEAFYRTARDEIKRHPSDLAIDFREYPLSYHQFAYDAARAAECAAAKGMFEPMYDELYGNQDSLGTLSFTLLARRAGITDTVSFGRCMTHERKPPAIEADIAAARAVGVRATPGIILNGTLYSGALPEKELETLVQQALATTAHR